MKPFVLSVSSVFCNFTAPSIRAQNTKAANTKALDIKTANIKALYIKAANIIYKSSKHQGARHALSTYRIFIMKKTFLTYSILVMHMTDMAQLSLTISTPDAPTHMSPDL